MFVGSFVNGASPTANWSVVADEDVEPYGQPHRMCAHNSLCCEQVAPLSKWKPCVKQAQLSPVESLQALVGACSRCYI